MTPKETNSTVPPLKLPLRCIECGKKEVFPAIVSERVQRKHDGVLYALDVPDFRVNRCRACGETYTDAAAGDQTASALRRHLGLLEPLEIRENLDRIGPTQREIARQLGVAAETLSRWLSGSVIQSRAMDNLLRLYFSLPQAREYLRREMAHAGA